MEEITVHIDYDDILNKINEMSRKEIDWILDVADATLAQLDISDTLENPKQVKHDMLLIAMYLIGEETNRQITEQTKK